jgi:hypothetical protein
MLGGVGEMRVHSSNCLAPTGRITVVARQPEGLFLISTTSHFMAILAQLMVLMTYWDIPLSHFIVLGWFVYSYLRSVSIFY